MYVHVMEGSIFCLGHGFHLCSLSETLLLAPDPWMAWPTSSWHTHPAALSVHSTIALWSVFYVPGTTLALGP